MASTSSASALFKPRPPGRHPEASDRVERVGSTLTELAARMDTTGLRVNRQGYLDRLDGLIYGDNPDQGVALGGGGFLLARTQNGHELVYDYFVQTPKRRVDRAPGFYPVHVDFGTTRQEFHIGAASIGTPGMVKGLFAIHHDLCRLPMTRLAQPAVRAARAGVVVDALQSYIFDVVKSIYLTSAESRAIFESRERPSELVQEGEILRQPKRKAPRRTRMRSLTRSSHL